MSVKYSGVLKFTDEIKAEIDLAADGTVEKAVVIDGDGTETPIGGGGGGDFSMAEVTLVNSTDGTRVVLIPVCYEPSPPFNPDASVSSVVNIQANETLILNVPLYKGHCSIVNGSSEDRLQGVTVATSSTVTSGSATSSMGGVDITGDCTITIS